MKKKTGIIFGILFVLIAGSGSWYAYQRSHPKDTNAEKFVVSVIKLKGYQLWQQKKYDEALEELKLATELEPENQKLAEDVKRLEAERGEHH